MSVECTSNVWKHSRHKGTDLLVLLALADAANQEGVCWPKVSTLARMSRMSERTIQRTLTKLSDSGEVRVLVGGFLDGKNQSSTYIVEVGQDVTPSQPVAPVVTDAVAPVVTGSGTTEEPPLEPPVEPSTASSGEAAAPDDGHLPGLAPPPSSPKDAGTQDPLIEELWSFYEGVFGERLRIKGLTDSRRRTLKAALRAAGDDVEVCKRAVVGLQSYRKTPQSRSNDVSIDAIFKTGPHDNKSLTEKIEFWASQAPDEGRPEVPGSVPSHERARVLELVASVLKPERMQLTDSQKERCDESAMILRRQFGLKVRSDGSGKWLGLEEVPKGEA